MNKINRLWISDFDKIRTKCAIEMFGGKSFGIYDNFPTDRKKKIEESNEIICFEEKQVEYIREYYPNHYKKISLILGIPNDYKKITRILKICIKACYLHGTFLNLKQKHCGEENNE